MLVATIAGCSLGSSACELVVGSGNYSSSGGGGGGSSSGSSGGGCIAVAGVTICKNSSSGASVSSGAGSSGGSASSGGSSGSSSGPPLADSATPFIVFTTPMSTENFDDCSDASYDTSASNPASTVTETITVVKNSNTSVTVTDQSGCVFTLNTYQTANDYFASGSSQSCAVTSTSGVTTTSTYNTFVVELPKGGTTATLAATGTATERGTVLTTCTDVTVTGTASTP